MHRAVYFGMLVAGLLAWSDSAFASDDQEDFFETKIRPVLAGTCYRCHGSTKTSGGLRIDSLEALLQGGDSGPAIVPGKPEESLLIKAIERQADLSAMPPDNALPSNQVADFVSWVKTGAIWPATSANTIKSSKHWAFEPIRGCEPPDVQNGAWIQSNIDRFIRSRQETAGVYPAPAADKLSLIRRATFDLTGLPPSPEEVDAFLHDNSPQAFEAVVDRLLGSPSYGEHWGRHWLDVVRYADTAGETADYPVPSAWRYRNYVIESFNADKPYDEFLREQIAGDVLANQGPAERYAEQVTATGYLAISRRFGFDSENYHHLTIQDTLDTVGQSILGLSLGCARCHDHKFDPITMVEYYALYGIFDSSRYSFPGSEQKQQVRSMAPLLPPSESRAKWQDFNARVAALASSLSKQQQPVPGAVLRSLADIDGDFELQSPAAGGSNGVLVSPWLYEGKIAITSAAQSPFKNVYAFGKVGTSLPDGAGPYQIRQAINPARSAENCGAVHVNLDFRIGQLPLADGKADTSHNDRERNGTPDANIQVAGRVSDASHRFSLGAMDAPPVVEVFISHEAISLRTGETIERLGSLTPGQWYNLQLEIDLPSRLISGCIGAPGSTTNFSDKPFASNASNAIECVVFESPPPGFTAAEPPVAVASMLPSIEFDNLGVQESRFLPVSTEPLNSVAENEPDTKSLNEQLLAIAGLDGDFELQTNESPPTRPWNPGPNSLVAISGNSQSPFGNIFAAGEFGVHLPNRAEYDGFGLTLGNSPHPKNGRLFVSFDFRCASADAEGNGSWRYYIGHGPGNSAAFELFFNDSQFFQRNGEKIETVDSLVIGTWYQVQLVFDLEKKTYTGLLASPSGKTEFTGQLASGWDGVIDYTFVDSYGHIGGVRPALDADNFAVSEVALPPFDTTPAPLPEGARDARRNKSAEIRKQLDELRAIAERQRQELSKLLAEGPCAMTYGMAEGTPHNVRLQLRGEPDQPGAEIPRGFLQVLGGGPLPSGTVGSGRLELAQWLTRPENSLTARVMANRIWQFHFGRGLVKTSNDFGFRGLPPTHPELLDYLATEFIRSGWSVKTMHKLIMLSATYQQSSLFGGRLSNADALADQSDFYVSYPRRRLSAEEIRDAILMVSGKLDPIPAHEHPFPSPLDWGYTQHAPFTAVYDHNKRSAYLMTQRLRRHPFLALFDGADPNATVADRFETTVPTQALFFLNDPFVYAKAESWAFRLQTTHTEEKHRIDSAYRQAFGRTPSEIESADATDFLIAYRAELAIGGIDRAELNSLAAFLRTLFASNEFLYVD